MKRTKYALSLLLAFMLVFGAMMSSAFAATPKDVENHWAADTVTKWVEQGLIKGYPDGTFKPNDPVKRGEFAALLNRAFNLSDADADVTFKDLTDKHWAYQDIMIGYKAGYLQGSGDGIVAPNSNTSRQEATVMIAKALHLDTTGTDVSQFNDADQIASWSKGAVAALAAAKVLNGDNNGKMNPTKPITRAETVVAINAALGLSSSEGTQDTVFDKAGTYGSADKTQTIEGNVVISAADVTLQNMVIKGNLTIAKEVGEGDVTLSKVTVEGTTQVNGGGEHSIHIEDSVLLRIIVDKASGKVRIVAIGATTVKDVIVNSPVKIEESNVTDSGFSNIELSDVLPAGSNVDLVGQFEDVRVLTANIQINLPSGSIDNLSVGQSAEGTTIDVGKEAKIAELVLNAVSKLIGQGQVDKATVNDGAKGSSFETKPSAVDGSGKEQETIPAVTGSGSNSGNNSGNNGNSGSDNGNSNGGNNGGTDNGGNNGGTDNGGGTGDVTEAHLSSLGVALDGELSLTQTDSSGNPVGTGFESDGFRYEVELPADFKGGDLTLQALAVNPNATKFVSVFKSASDGAYTNLTASENGYTFHLNAKQDAEVNISVISPDGKRNKYYTVEFYYQRSLQEAFHIVKSVNGDYASYSLQSNLLKGGDVVTVDVSEADSSNAAFTVSDSVYGNSHGINMQLYDYSDVNFNSFKPTDLKGTIHITVTRGEDEVISGDYHYDFTPVTTVTDNTGIVVYRMTTEELRQEDAYNNEVNRTSFGLKITTDASVQAYASMFKFNFAMITNASQAPKAMTMEDTKLSYDKYESLHGLYKVNNSYPYQHTFLGFNPVYDMYIYLTFYDANGNVVGYYTEKVTFDKEHIGESYQLAEYAPVPNAEQ